MGFANSAVKGLKFDPLTERAEGIDAGDQPRALKIFHVPDQYKSGLLPASEQVLIEIQSDLHSSNNPESELFIYALQGDTGTGKSVTARAYVEKFHPNYHSTLWIRCEILEAFRLDMVRCYYSIFGAPALKNIIRNHNGHIKDAEDSIIKSMGHWLAERDRDWLIIFDDVTEVAIIKGFLRSVAAQKVEAAGKGYIIITSTTRAVCDPSLCKSYKEFKEQSADDVGSFIEQNILQAIPKTESRITSKEITSQYFIESLTTSTPASEAKNLATDLKCCPYALRIAFAYMKKEECSLVAYRAKYAESNKTCSYKHFKRPNSKDRSYFTVLNITLNAISLRLSSPKLVYDFIGVIAFLDGTDLDDQLLKEIYDQLRPQYYKPTSSLSWLKGKHVSHTVDDPLEFHKFLFQLEEYSLLNPIGENNKNFFADRILLKTVRDGLIGSRKKKSAIVAYNALSLAIQKSSGLEKWKYTIHAKTCIDCSKDLRIDDREIKDGAL